MRSASYAVTICVTLLHLGIQPMATDYTAAIVSLFGLVALLTGMTVFVLSRPSDLAPLRDR